MDEILQYSIDETNLMSIMSIINYWSSVCKRGKKNRCGQMCHRVYFVCKRFMVVQISESSPPHVVSMMAGEGGL